MSVIKLPPTPARRPGTLTSWDAPAADPYLSRLAVQRARDEKRDETLAIAAAERPPVPGEPNATPSAFTPEEVEALKAIAQAAPVLLRAANANPDRQGLPNQTASTDARPRMSLNDRFHQRAAAACAGKQSSTDGRRRRIGEGAYSAYRGSAA